MRGILLFIMLALAACQGGPGPAAGPAPEIRGWQLASGKPPTRLEFDALVAACSDRQKRALAQAASGGLDSCLTDLGLRRAEP